MKRCLFIAIACLGIIPIAAAQQAAPKPLFRDPEYDGAADPVIVYNKKKKAWWMLYTNRRATCIDSTGVKWVHGTRIGIAASYNGGADWVYVDTADIGYRPDSAYTFWAPEVIRYKNRYHLYLTYVPGIFSDWNHPREIVHLTSRNLRQWTYQSTLQLANQKVIDACVYALPGGGWRMWYNNEKDGKSIYYADSKDLYHWTDKGKAIAARGEGPKVFRWKDRYWMLVDVWKGMEIYASDDLQTWTKQTSRILEEPGTGTDDQTYGGHADVVVQDDRAYVFYFIHPGRRKDHPAAPGTVAERRSVIQLAELEYKDGMITCDRNKPVSIHLDKN
ncbi:MAG: family 43 glycosylhydrolase [Chitinophagaceae bacterium]